MKRIVFILALIINANPVFAAESADLQTLTLEQAHEIALRNHPGLAAANYRTLAAKEVVKQARAAEFPQINLYGSAVEAGANDTRILAGGLNNPSVFDRTAVGAGATQLITDFGRTSNLVASSKFQASAASENETATVAQVLLDVDRSYFAVLQAQAIQRVAQQTVDTRQLLLDRVNILASNKLKSDLDLSFARVALAEGTLQLQNARNNVDSSMATLSSALGYRELKQFRLVDATTVASEAPPEITKLIDTALRKRPELASLADERDAALKLARAQRDARLPAISAVFSGGDAFAHDARLPDNYLAGGLQLSVPVFAGGLYASRQHEAEFRAKAIAEGLRTAEDNVIRDVRIAWLSVNDAIQRLQTTQQLRDYAQRAYELAQARYNVGSSSIVELSQAQLALSSAEIANASARYDLLIKQANLKYQTGESLNDAAAGSSQP